MLLRNLTQAMGKQGWSGALGTALTDAEARLTALGGRRAGMVTTQDRANVLPHPKVIEGYLQDVLTILQTDPVRGQALLATHVGKIVLTPQIKGPDRHYLATGAFNLSAFLGRKDRLIENLSCGGAIEVLSTTYPYFVRLPSSHKVA